MFVKLHKLDKSKSRLPWLSTCVNPAYSAKISLGESKLKPLANPMALATSQIIFQSCFASPVAGNKPRWREIRRSELVTVPSFSDQPVAGKAIWANSRVSFLATQSDTTTNSHLFSASAIFCRLGILTIGLVAMIHTALTFPLLIFSNKSTAFSPCSVAMVGDCQ